LPDHGKRACFQNGVLLVKNRVMNSKRKLVSVYFSHAPFSLLFTHDSLAMQAVVWLCMVRFGTSCKFKMTSLTKFKEKTMSSVQISMVVVVFYPRMELNVLCASESSNEHKSLVG
jgi:hypothetical protein